MGKVIELLCGCADNQSLIELRDKVNEYSDELLNEYLEYMSEYCKSHTLSCSHDKNFYDAVWGTININEGEIVVINSPLLQRLRKIKQLGLVDLLYSSANHSRFSHTIGVLQAATSMGEQINRELRKKNESEQKDVMQLIRLAAIFHDCGHMFCSHASERFFQTNANYSKQKDVESIRNCFRKSLGNMPKPGLAEIISVLMVASPSVRSLLRMAKDGFFSISFNDHSENDFIEKICCFILGFPYSKDYLPFSQIISGQIDADKLDYLKRDSHATGVPVAVDMSRIFQKLRVEEPTKPITMVSNPYDQKNDKSYAIAIAPTALSTVDQLVISRYMMFENVYFHQKVLTAEEMLRHALEILDGSTEGILNDFRVIFKLNDGIVINDNFADTVQSIITRNDKFKILDNDKYQRACAIFRDLSRRRLFKRCISFSLDGISSLDEVDSSFYEDVIVKKDNNARKVFLDLVKKEIEEIKNVLKKDNIYFCDTTDIIFIAPPDIAESIKSNIMVADRKHHERNDYFMSDSWLKSKSSAKKENYLATYEEDRYITFLATEKVLFKHYRILISEDALYGSGDELEIISIKKKLQSKGYYRDSFSLLPDNDVRNHEEMVKNLISKWKTYERFDLENGKRVPFSYSYISAYIMQFVRYAESIGNFDSFVYNCIKMFENILVVDKNFILQALDNNFTRICSQVDRENITVCSLGNTQDSSSQIAYQVNEINQLHDDLSKTSKFTVRKLEDIKVDEMKDNIVFIEDAFSSSKQLISIFEEYMGVSIEKRIIKEHHADELSDEKKEKLKASKLYFMFLFYNKHNKEFFIKKMAGLGLNDVEIVAANDFMKPYFDGINDEDEKNIVMKYFEAAGKDLMVYKAYKDGKLKEGWTEDRIEKSLLGYENAQQLIVFPWNTPTYTITALWLGSKEWFPLFRRVDK